MPRDWFGGERVTRRLDLAQRMTREPAARWNQSLRDGIGPYRGESKEYEMNNPNQNQQNQGGQQGGQGGQQGGQNPNQKPGQQEQNPGQGGQQGGQQKPGQQNEQNR
jgi:hypothetical protein